MPQSRVRKWSCLSLYNTPDMRQERDISHPSQEKSDEDRKWWKRGACSELNPDWTDKYFYSDKKENQEIAKSFCAVCPVRTECLDDAVKSKNKFGIWGGTTYEERKRL